MDPSTLLEAPAPVQLPRITISFCTQCKWMLRAAYFAQELLSTFSTSLGEVALIPSTGGVFAIDIVHATNQQSLSKQERPVRTYTSRLWDRKTEGGFPETKTLKRLVRDIIDPSRDLGHVDGKKIQKTDADDNDDGNASTEPVAVPFHAGADGREDDEGKMEEKEDSVMVHDAEASLMKEVGRSPGGKTAAEEEEEEEEGKGEREAKRDVKVKDACEDCS